MNLIVPDWFKEHSERRHGLARLLTDMHWIGRRGEKLARRLEFYDHLDLVRYCDGNPAALEVTDDGRAIEGASDR